MPAVQPLESDALDAQVLAAKHPVALDFFLDSCAPCHVLEPRLERVARAFEGDLRVYRIDIDQDMTIAEKFGVESLPTV